MDSFPFTRQASRDLLTSAEEKSRALKSSLTEGSSRLFGSVMDAKRGIVGGLTSTFDKAVSIVGGATEGTEQTEADPGSAAPVDPGSAAADSRPARPARPPNVRADSASSNSSSSGKPRPPKPPAPMNRQRSDLDSNGSLKQVEGDRMSRQNTVPAGPQGNQRAGPPGRSNPFSNDGGSTEEWSQRGKTRPHKKDGGESDADSESTEGCDEIPDEDDYVVESSEFGSPSKGTSMLKSGSKNSNQSWNEEEAMDPTSQECISFMKYFVQKIFDQRAEITAGDKQRLGEYCQKPIGRLWFSRNLSTQSTSSQTVSEEILFNLVQFSAIALFECNESDDYGPAKTIMNLCFTLHRLGADGSKQYLYSLLRDQSIWQSQRFWNAAFFYSVQHERSRKIHANSAGSQTDADAQRQQEKIIVSDQLKVYTSYMRAFGISKEHCVDFLKKQSAIANLSKGQVRALQEHVERWSEDQFVTNL